MAGIAKKDLEGRAGCAARDSGAELEALRAELERYRNIFDSARMIIGHEVIRPLTAVSGYAELLEGRFEAFSGEQERRYFARIREAVGQMRTIVEAFVQMLMFETKAQRAGEKEFVDLRAVVEKLRPTYGSLRSRLRNAIDPGLGPVYLSRVHVEVVLDNLISNALKYGGSDAPVTVEASLRPERRGAAEGDVLMLTVADRGIGIPASELEAIFDPFYRIGGEGGGGLGLGLALVKNIVSMMEGEIRIDSAPDEGTRVTVSVPVRPRDGGNGAGEVVG
ncbi:MAG: HAMP domain-containing sensor histidine kinase [Candidatus Krumholzibacteria bacterium]|nr:HAMP domain-containing sensor histidine kinase [Candidatus Krumholzibacteria bacterium]